MKSTVKLCCLLAFLSACAPTPDMPDWESQIRDTNEALLNQGNIELIPELFAADYLAHNTGGDIVGREGIAGYIESLRSAFPDLQVEIEVLATEWDRVAWLRTHRGTHQGDHMGVAATGRSMVWQAIIVSRYEEGKIAEEWGVSEIGSLLLNN